VIPSSSRTTVSGPIGEPMTACRVDGETVDMLSTSLRAGRPSIAVTG
jgi:hypothetical protein